MRPILALGGALAGAAAFAVAAAPASAQQWPAHPITVVSPFVGGSTHDFVAQMVLDQAGPALGTSFALQDRPGGGGTAGVAAVVRAKPDGYTLLLMSSAMSEAVILHKALPYDAGRDLVPVAMFGGQPAVLVAAPAKGFRNVSDVVAAAKAAPGTLTFGSLGVGSASYLAGERFRLAADIDVRPVAFPGAAEVLAALIAGRVDYFFMPVAPAVPFILQSRLVPLGVSTPSRLPVLPNVPTLAEAGFPAREYLLWDGLAAPAKTPPDIVAKLNAAVEKVLGSPATRSKLQRLGFEPAPMSPQDFAGFFAGDVAAMVKLGKDAHIEPTD